MRVAAGLDADGVPTIRLRFPDLKGTDHAGHFTEAVEARFRFVMADGFVVEADGQAVASRIEGRPRHLLECDGPNGCVPACPFSLDAGEVP